MILKDAITHAASLQKKPDETKDATIEDLSAMLADMPEAKRRNQQVLKHLEIVKHCKMQIDARQLFAISALEQQIATKEDHSAQSADFQELLHKPSSAEIDLLRIAMVYHLRFEDRIKKGKGILDEVTSYLKSRGVSPDDLSVINKVVQYAGRDSRAPWNDIFGNKETKQKLMSKFSAKMDWLFEDGDTNGLLMHTPLLHTLLTDLKEGKLSERDFPELGQAPSPTRHEVIVFIVGGATYAEVSSWPVLTRGCVVSVFCLMVLVNRTQT
jgi:hypothetical protein